MEPVNILKIILDSILFAITLVAWALVHWFQKSRKTGFHCNDYSIGLEYKESTISNLMLVFICTLTPLLFILTTEFINTWLQSRSSKTNKEPFKYKLSIFNKKTIEISNVLANIYIHLGAYFFGLLVVQFLYNLAKYSVGRLRPHFIDICKPIETSTNRTITLHDCSIKQYYRYDVDFTCSGTNAKRIKEASLSFPSGHAATTFYTCIFLVIYINYRWRCLRHSLLTPFIQLALTTLAIYTAISRVFDHKHHVTDVLTGSILGTLFAIFTYYLLINKWTTNLKKFINNQQKQFDNDLRLNQINQQEQQHFTNKTGDVYSDNVVL